MDDVQFNRLKSAVRWAAFEASRDSDGHIMWNQDTWFLGEVNGMLRSGKGRGYRTVNVACYSSFCIAGNVVFDAGDKFLIEGSYEPGTRVNVDYCLPKDGGDIAYVNDRAMELLGITETHGLFAPCLEIEDVIERAQEVALDYGYELTEADIYPTVPA